MLNIPLDSFELHFAPSVLERGLRYYEEGRVGDLRVSGPVVDAAVSGGEDYEVQLEVHNQVIASAFCTCPVGTGFCKHVVAVVFAMTADGFGEGVVTKKGKMKVVKPMGEELGRKKEQAARKTTTTPPKAKLENSDLIDAIGLAEIRDWLVKELKADKVLEARFRKDFFEYLPCDTLSEATQRVRDILNTMVKSKNRRVRSDEVVAAFEPWTLRIENAIANKDFEHASVLLNATIPLLDDWAWKNVAFDQSLETFGNLVLDLCKSALSENERAKVRKWMTKHWPFLALNPTYYIAMNEARLMLENDEHSRRAFLNTLSRDPHRFYANSAKQYRYLAEKLRTGADKEIYDDFVQFYAPRSEELVEYLIDQEHLAGNISSAKEWIKYGIKKFSYRHEIKELFLNRLVQHERVHGTIQEKIEALTTEALFEENLEGLKELESLLQGADLKKFAQYVLNSGKTAEPARVVPLLALCQDFTIISEYLNVLETSQISAINARLLVNFKEAYFRSLLIRLEREIGEKAKVGDYQPYSEIMIAAKEHLGEQETDRFVAKMASKYPTRRTLIEALKGKYERRSAGEWWKP